MAKTDKGRINQNITNSQSTTNAQMGTLWDQNMQNYNQVNPMQQQERENLTNRYNQMYDSRGINADDAARLRAITGPYTYESGAAAGASSGGDSGGSSGGGSSAPQVQGPAMFSRSENVFQDFANSGGVNYGALTESLGGYRELSGKNAGYDPDRLNSINAGIGGLRKIGETGGISNTGQANIRSDIAGMRGIGQNGGFDDATRARLQGDISRMRGFGETGGFDQARLDQINGTIGQANNFAQTGGLSPDDIARMRDSGYEEFANTGGISGQQRANIRARGTSPITALYAQNKASLDRAQGMSGAPGYAATMAKMARGTGQAMSEAGLNAELGIMDKVNQGRQFGITGRAAQETQLQNLLSSNKLGGMNLAGNLGLGLGSAQANNRISATAQAGEADASLANTIAQNRLAGLGAAAGQEQSLENTLTQNRLAGLGQSTNAEMNLQSDMNQTRLAGLGGITDTTGQAEGMVQQGRMQGAQGLMQVDEARAQEAARQASIAAANAANANAAAENRAADDYRNRQLASQNEQFLISTGLGAQQGALSGLGSLYQTTPGYAQTLQGNMMNIAGNQAGANQGYIGQQTQAAQLPGWFDRAMQVAGAGASLAGAFGSGGAAPAISSARPTGGVTSFTNPNLIGGSSYGANYWGNR